MIDLRSDTVTHPSSAMWEAMRAAPLADDVLGDDSAVTALESKVAALLGKEAALFTPSGTMANQLAIRSVCEPGDEILTHRENHIIHYETGSPAALSGCMIAPLDGNGGIFAGSDVTAALRSTDIHDPHSRMVIAENTHNRGGGAVWSLEQFQDVAQAAHAAELHVHIDGARLLNASIAGGYDPGAFAADADSVSICFSKGLGAPVGSSLAGSSKLIQRARRFRKMFGGGMRQSGLLAAAASYALDNNVQRLAEDHANAEMFATTLAAHPSIDVEPVAGGVRTNMVFFRVLDAHNVTNHLHEHGVAMIPMGPTRVRAVMHLDVSSDDVARAAAIVIEALS
jgi:threonine aldolase